MTGEPRRWWAVVCLTPRGARSHGDPGGVWPKDRAEAEALARGACFARCGAPRMALQVEEREEGKERNPTC